MIKVPTQNTPQIFGIFTPQTNCRDQKKLTVITPRNSFQATAQKTSFTGGVDIKWPNVISCVTLELPVVIYIHDSEKESS